MTKQDVDAAIAELKRAIEIDPDFANAHALLGQCHVHIGMRGWIRPARLAFEEARRWAEKAVHLAPTNPQANQSLAFVLAVTGEAERAIRVAQRAIELNSNYAEAYAVLGHALVFRGDLEGGLAACQRAERGTLRDSAKPCIHDNDTLISSSAIMKKRSTFRRRGFTRSRSVRRASDIGVFLCSSRSRQRNQALRGRAASPDSALLAACPAEESNVC